MVVNHTVVVKFVVVKGIVVMVVGIALVDLVEHFDIVVVVVVFALDDLEVSMK